LPIFKFQIQILLIFFFSVSCSKKQIEAELIITNANIWTGNQNHPSAQAMAVSGDSILAIGSTKEIEKFKGFNTRVEDMQGAFVTPGFIDSHVHLMTGGRSLLSVDLRGAKTPNEFSLKVAAFAATQAPNEWIYEGNWDHTLWGGELPKKEWIDDYTPKNPCALFRLDWHMLLANSAALKFAGIDRNTPNPEGGTIEKDANGNPTGILKDNAMNLILDKAPPMSIKQKNSAFEAATSYFLSNGVTTVHDVDGLNKNFESYSTALSHQKNPNVRIYASLPLNEWERLDILKTTNTKWLKTGSLKGFVDGSLGSHTAAFFEPYSNQKNENGFFLNKSEDLYKWVSGADKSGYQVFVHAIGDSAINAILNIYEIVTKENGPRDRRFRIEHAQHLDSKDLGRFAKLNIIASMQPYHAIDDGRWAEDYIGAERIKNTYAFKSLLDHKATLTFGSDWAVAPASPILGIYAAVSRQTLDGNNPKGWVPQQKITTEQALKAYTITAAYASFDEKLKGSLEKGKLADFVVLSNNILKASEDEIKNTKVLKTYVGGKKKFDYVE
jgi:predicted amidohydrolase YtcJ